jgi:hypothetical protein
MKTAKPSGSQSAKKGVFMNNMLEKINDGKKHKSGTSSPVLQGNPKLELFESIKRKLSDKGS